MSEQTLDEILAACTSEPVEIDYDNYVDASEFPPPVPEGNYLLKSGWQDPAKKFNVSGGNLVAILKHTVIDVGTSNDGHTIGFDRVSTKTYERSGVKVSGAVDQIRAWGITDKPKTPAEFAAVISAAVDNESQFRAFVQWEAGCNHAGTEHEVEWTAPKEELFRVKGMKNFPLLPDGSRNSEIECKICKQTVRARERIGRRLPA